MTNEISLFHTSCGGRPSLKKLIKIILAKMVKWSRRYGHLNFLPSPFASYGDTAHFDISQSHTHQLSLQSPFTRCLKYLLNYPWTKSQAPTSILLRYNQDFLNRKFLILSKPSQKLATFNSHNSYNIHSKVSIFE